MANIRQPQYGVEKDELTLTTQDPASVLYGINPNNKFIPIKVTTDGSLAIGATIEFEASDLQIGAVEIKNATTEDRVVVSVDGELRTESRLHDAAGTGLTSTLVSGKQALDVNLVNSLALTIDEATSDILVYGWDGAANQKIKTNVSGELQVGIVGTPTVNQGTSPWIIDGTVAATQSGAWSVAVNNFPATQNVSVTNATLAVTQSGVWSTGRTWTLASGTDSVSAVQSGTWNINNISGTISLPTGAATEATLADVEAKTAQLTFAATRLLVDGSGVTQPISASSLPLPTGASTEATLSNFRTDFNAVDFATEATLATRASETTLSGFRTDFNAVDFATETTLLAVNTNLDQFSFTGGSVDSNITNATLAVTQSGAWSTGRTWTLASGTDSVSAVQSGTWNINDVSGTISLPTGASTSSNQTNGSQKTQIVDGSGNVIGSTANALDVNIKSGVTLEVNLDNANDDVLAYGFDGATNRAIKTDAAGELQVDVLTLPAVAISQTGTDNDVDVTDEVTRELGRVLASDVVIAQDSYTTTSDVFANARPTEGDIEVRHYKTKTIFVRNTAVNNGRINIFGSVDDGANYDVVIVNNAALNAGVTSITNLSDAITHIRIEARSSNNGQSTTFITKGYALGV